MGVCAGFFFKKKLALLKCISGVGTTIGVIIYLTSLVCFYHMLLLKSGIFFKT